MRKASDKPLLTLIETSKANNGVVPSATEIERLTDAQREMSRPDSMLVAAIAAVRAYATMGKSRPNEPPASHLRELRSTNPGAVRIAAAAADQAAHSRLCTTASGNQCRRIALRCVGGRSIWRP